MYFIGKQKKADDTSDRTTERRRGITGVPEYDETLEPSFVFEAEGSGFIRVKNSRKKTDEAVPEIVRAPIAIF